MADRRRLIVTGSRQFSRPSVVRHALTQAQGRRPEEMQLVHGQCDPRTSGGHRIPWLAAKDLPGATQRLLYGADWQADLAALELGWPEPERHPADWRRGKAGGPERNVRMAARGGDEGHAFLSAGLRNQGTMGCAVLMAKAGIPVLFWCDACCVAAPVLVPVFTPCDTHQIDEVGATWRRRTGVLL